MSRKNLIDQLWLVDGEVTLKEYGCEVETVDRIHRLVKADSAEQAAEFYASEYEKDEPHSYSTRVEILSVTGVLQSSA